MRPEEMTFNDLIEGLKELFGLNKSAIARMIGVKANTVTENLQNNLLENRNRKACRRLIKLSYSLIYLKAQGYENSLILEALNFPIISSPTGLPDSIVSAIVQDRQIDFEIFAEKSDLAIREVIESKRRAFDEFCSPIKKLMMA